MPDVFDVAVAGVGVAGAFLLRNLSKDLSVVGIDKREKLGFPVECGEIVPVKKEMRILLPNLKDYSLFDIPEKYESNRTDYIRFIAPDGREFISEFKMHVVKRDEMISDVAESGGHRIMKSSRIVSFRKESNAGIIRLDNGEKIVAKIVAGCDGANSRIAAGLKLKKLLAVPAKQYVMRNVDCDEDSIYMYVGKKISPGGYAWIIPKGDGIANVGIGFVSSRAEKGDTIRKALDRFIKEYPYSSKYLKSAEIAGEIGAVVPVDLPYERAVYDNTILLGDAAGMVISHVGAGIPTSMVAGDLAAKVINESFEGGDFSHLQEFDLLWKKSMLETIKSSYFIKTLWDRISDSDERLSRYLKLINNRDMWEILHSRTPLKLRVAAFFIPILNLFF